ncbi:MAG: DUF4382 domain-containing protein [Candidatus Heimdallarchaeota archaeon]|jgi:hypothetical protein|nr:DUF4382 domain-containing protein [Candidatus Heimdallarchaeota archaeon]MCK4254164.1 DUF4382 domain-containing protein [Candidatus Heimdallarchaeota archaeon]
MHKRNQLTIILSTIIISSAIIAGLITIKDSDTIISDFQNFVDNPFTWEPPTIPDQGNLHLYITSDMYENESAVLPLDGIKLVPPSYEIYHIYLIIDKILIKQKGTDTLIDLVDEPITIDLKALNNSIDLFDAFVIPEGQYSALHFYYEKNIIADTNIGNKTFSAVGSDFFTIPFFPNKNNNTPTDLQINKNEETELLLTLQMQITWQQQIMFPHFFGYLDFTIPV